MMIHAHTWKKLVFQTVFVFIVKAFQNYFRNGFSLSF